MPAELAELRKDPAWRILNYKYEVYVPRFVTLDAEFITQRGITVYENDNPNEELFRFVYAERLIDYVHRGVIPRFKEYTKAKELCDDIQALLKQWERTVYESVDVVEVPVQDLEDLEDLYKAIYRQARISEAEGILAGNTVTTRFERYFAQRNSNLVVGKEARIAALPAEPNDAFALVNKAVARRFGE